MLFTSGMPTLRENLFVIFDIEIIQKRFVGILSVKAGFNEKTLFAIPFLESPIIKHLFTIFNNERHDVETQAFLKRYKPAYSAVSVLEWMDFLKMVMKSNNIKNRYRFYFRILVKEFLHFSRDLGRKHGFRAAYDIRLRFIFAHVKPRNMRILRSCS